jgi:hypothetical protein
MSPETKKTLIYGGVISFAVGVGLYIWTQYENGNQPDDSNAAAAAQAQAQAAATNQETELAELAQLGSSGTAVEPATISDEAPSDDFSSEVAGLLQAEGLDTPASTTAQAPSQNNPVVNPPDSKGGTWGAQPIISKAQARSVIPPVATYAGAPASERVVFE